MPSTPTWYRTSKPDRIAIPTASAAPEKTIPRERSSRSSREGVRAITAAPAAGRKTASETADCSQPLIAALRSFASRSQPRDHEREDRHAGEQEHGVALDVARLDVPQDAARRPRADPDAVDRSVDRAAVEGVHALRDRVLDRADDPLVVQVVHVVLALEHAVGGAEREDRVALAIGPVQRPAEPETGGRDADGQDRERPRERLGLRAREVDPDV